MNNEQKLVLAHVVVDPDAWYEHAITTFGQEKADQFLAEKVTRHQADYDKAAKESNYKNRAQREAENNLSMLAEQANQL
jgi:hypothetical protein